MQATEQTSPIECGKYRKWQLTRLQKLYAILKIDFDTTELDKKSRSELKELVVKANNMVRQQKLQNSNQIFYSTTSY